MLSYSFPSVLAHATAEQVQRDPFPYLVVENCLPPELYAALARSYPADEVVLNLNAWRRKGAVQENQRNDISAHQLIEHPGAVDPLWEAFVRRHTSPEFFRDVVRVFGPAIAATYPQLNARLGCPLGKATTGVRFVPGGDEGQVSLDCQIGINTATSRTGSVRRVHADAPEELYAMLLYFRQDGDTAEGGDLEIHRWKDRRSPRFCGSEANDGDAELVRTVPYRANTLVAFINSDRSLHAVSPRQPSAHSRRLVNIIGEVYRSVPEGLFVKTQSRALRLQRKLQRWRERISA